MAKMKTKPQRHPSEDFTAKTRSARKEREKNGGPEESFPDGE